MKKDVNSEIQLLVNRFKKSDFKGVLDKSSSLVKEYPKNDFIWNLSGLSFQKIGDIKNSITSFQNAVIANPKNNAAHNNLAISFKVNKQYAKAEKILKELLKKNPNYLNALVNFANLKSDTYFFEEAVEYYKKALQIQQDSPQLYSGISQVLQNQNKLDEAKKFLAKALKIDKNFTRGDELLSRLIDYGDPKNDEHLKKMIYKLDNLKLNDDSKTRLHFSIGKAFEDKKDFEKSFYHLEIANSVKSRLSKSLIKFHRQKAESLKKFFSELDFSKVNKYEDTGNKIFILGLPRSGTTLLERIISSHPKVSSVSEISVVFDEISKNIFSDGSMNEEKSNNFIQIDFNKKYLNILNSFNIKNDFIIDKTLVNFWYIGFIKIFFPNSKIIHSLRNPKDNCLSIYKNLFPTNERWLYNQEEMGEYYLIYNDLMKFWNKLFKNQIYNSKYEDLVNNKDKFIREIISFCGLEWDDKCLNHHKNNNPIKTLSLNQANKPIYKSSINSSKLYERKLNKLFKILDKLE